MKGKVYRKPVTYSVCRKILAAESIDCLFFLAGGHREDFFSQKEKTPLLSQLEPVLRAANGHKLRRVCLLSSVDLEEEGLLSPALEELRAGERVLLSHCRERRLPVLLLRTGCVFGEAPPDQGGFLGQVLTQLQGSGKVLCPFREEASFDFVCGSDLADAVCRLFHLEAGGVYRVVTGAPVTAGELYAMAAQALGKEPQVEFGEEGHGSPDPALGKELWEACGWMPFYLFKETGPVYVKSSLSRERERQKGEEKRRLSLRKRQPLLFETLQNLGLFLIMLLLTGWTADWNDLRYVDVRLLYVVIVAISFGMRQGLLATVLAIASYGTDPVDFACPAFAAGGLLRPGLVPGLRPPAGDGDPAGAGFVLPLCGIFAVQAGGLLSQKGPQFQMDSLYLGHGEMLDELELLRPMDKSAEVDKVPGVDTLRAGEYGRRRRMVMDTLREQDTAEYLSVLKEALLNEDQETSHYASAVIMDLQKRIQASVLERQRAYRQEPEEELYRILESGAFDENSLGRYYTQYREISDVLLAREDGNPQWYHRRVGVDLRTGEDLHARETAEAFLEKFPENEDAVVDCIQVYLQMRDRKALDRLLDRLGDLPVVLTQKSLTYIRFLRERKEARG